MKKLWNIAVVGATDAVGSQVIECLQERDFPVGKIKFLASDSSVGEALEYNGKAVLVEKLAADSFAGVDIALFAAGVASSEEFCLAAARAGAVCIDTSSAWQRDLDVPLVVPEVNPEVLVRYTRKGIVASPNSSTIQMVVALKALHDFANIKRIVVSTYHSVSGTGQRGLDELRVQTGELLNGRPAKHHVYPHRIAFNCLPQIDSFCDNGYTREEMKMVLETARVLGPEIKTTATCVRVPVFYGHSQSINIETERKVTVEKARELLREAQGVELIDEPKEHDYPMAINAVGEDFVGVGRIREDESVENGLNLWVVADNLRKGAATNVVQIAELLVEKYLK